VLPRIEIEKTASPVEYGADGIGYFTIKVTNPGPVDLIDVHVTDDVALAIDPESDCAQADLPDLAVGESYEYQCSVSNLDGVSPFTNEATSIGTGPDGTEVTDTDDASVVPPVLATTITQPPPTTPPSSVPPTLPVTGASFEQMRIFSISGLLILLAGAALIWGTSLIGRRNEKARAAAMGAVYHEITLKVEPRPRGRILHIRLKPTRHGSRPPAD
jgi:uncharacterized repeat protein (TIGR01451 family)